ncbi:hypothetical protein Q9L58_010258 [Maublancomyces gigas]|uniref:Uncharacterized protein n=1 Tax=Discina gigas TaxID=1032678 RepID=A0ABR3G4N3_9PEZI
MPPGPVGCFDYPEAITMGSGCGTFDKCLLCDDARFPFCITTTILGGQLPLTGTICAKTAGTITHAAGTDPTTMTISAHITTTIIAPTSVITVTPITITTRITDPPTVILQPPPTNTVTTVITPSVTARPLPIGAIVGIGLGAFFALAVIALLAIFLLRKSRAPPAPLAPPAPPAPVMSPGPPGYPQQGGAAAYNYGYGQGQPKYPQGTPVYEVSAQ